METQTDFHSYPSRKSNIQTFDPAEIYQISQVEMIAVSADMIRRETQGDPTLTQY